LTGAVADHPDKTGAVKIGDVAPEFTLPNQDGDHVSLSDFAGRWLVVYFYPADDTPGCTKESCAFRDAYEDFTDLGAEVIGISSDTVEKHKAFAAKHRLPFTLLADTDQAVRNRWGAKGKIGLFPGRITYVIDPGGVVRKVFNSQFQVTRHHKEALETIRGG
jgi:peroxiredoxin Q/BCP